MGRSVDRLAEDAVNRAMRLNLIPQKESVFLIMFLLEVEESLILYGLGVVMEENWNFRAEVGKVFKKRWKIRIYRVSWKIEMA